jgi:hypothetical protein
MNMSVNARHARDKAHPLEAAVLKVSQAQTIEVMPQTASARTSWTMALVVGLGASLTLGWAGLLLWTAGYLIGVW